MQYACVDTAYIAGTGLRSAGAFVPKSYHIIVRYVYHTPNMAGIYSLLFTIDKQYHRQMIYLLIIRSFF